MPVQGIRRHIAKPLIGFKNIDEKVNKASKDLAEERGACPDAEEFGIKVVQNKCTKVEHKILVDNG